MPINAIPTQEELQNQLTDLKADILELSRTLSSRADNMAKRVEPAIDEAGHRLRDAAGAARAQGQAMVDTVRENPGTASSIAVTAGVLGLAIGYVIGSTFQSSPGSLWR